MRAALMRGNSGSERHILSALFAVQNNRDRAFSLRSSKPQSDPDVSDDTAHGSAHTYTDGAAASRAANSA